MVDHVKNQQRLHPVVGEAFPSFGERDVAEPARMSKEGAVLRVMHGRRVLCAVFFGKLFGCSSTRRARGACAGRLSFGRRGEGEDLMSRAISKPLISILSPARGEAKRARCV